MPLVDFDSVTLKTTNHTSPITIAGGIGIGIDRMIMGYRGGAPSPCTED